MRIVSLTAENVKRLKAVHIEPDGDVVVISGANGVGKSSVIDSIWYALGGGAALKDTPRPIRDGEDHASVTLDLGDLIVTRTWKGENTTLKVTSKDGASYSSPTTMLAGLIGRLSFDPLAFTQQDAKSQVATLLELVELPFDPEALAMKRRGVFEQRTEAGRILKALEGQLAALTHPGEDTPNEEISVSSILSKQAAYSAAVNEYRSVVEDVDDAEANLRHAIGQLELAQSAVERAEASVIASKIDVEAFKTALAEMTEPDPDIDFEAELASVEETNRLVRARHAYIDTYEQAQEAVGQIAAFTARIDAIDAEKAHALSEASMPLEGLAFDEEGVTYKGIPFAQCSSAEQLRVSMAMAMAANPEIRVIRIMDGSLLDSSNMALISEMASDQDFQIWIERVDESGEVGIIIENGEVRA